MCQNNFRGKACRLSCGLCASISTLVCRSLTALLIFLFASCVSTSTQDRMFTSVEKIEENKIIAIVKTQFSIYEDYETFESIKGTVYRKLLAEAKSKYKHLNIDIRNITIEGKFSWLNVLTIPIINVTPFIMRINARGFVIVKE
jgi:hypothetical protein